VQQETDLVGTAHRIKVPAALRKDDFVPKVYVDPECLMIHYLTVIVRQQPDEC